jgi:hypothetical protein
MGAGESRGTSYRPSGAGSSASAEDAALATRAAPAWVNLDAVLSAVSAPGASPRRSRR